jgi:hypothetical protein
MKGSCSTLHVLSCHLVTDAGSARCTAGKLGKALDLEDDEDLSPGESGDIRSADELLGDGGLDDVIGEGFSARENRRAAVADGRDTEGRQSCRWLGPADVCRRPTFRPAGQRVQKSIWLIARGMPTAQNLGTLEHSGTMR